MSTNFNLHFGKDKNDKDIYIDLQKENLHTIFMAGSTGTGKSILHYYLYKQLMDQNTPEKLGFVFMDMTRVDFILWKNPYLYQPVIVEQSKAIDVLEKLAEEKPTDKNIFIHIEECDMFMIDRDRIENAWEKIRQSPNVYAMFSTSRPSPDVLTEKFKANTALKIVFNVATDDAFRIISGKDIKELFVDEADYRGGKMIVYKDKTIITKPFDDKLVKEIERLYK